MKLIYPSLAAMLLIGLIASCETKSTKPAFYNGGDEEGVAMASDDNDHVESQAITSGEIVVVPFTEQNGVKMVEVKINETIGVEMVLDSGCSNTLISADEAEYLYRKGVLTQDDIEGFTSNMIADGTIMNNVVVNLSTVTIADNIAFHNVKATVSSSSRAPLLLGNEILNRTASYEVDNTNKVINFTLR